MAKSSTSFTPGQSGNPKGRPPKSRALTALLEKGGGRKIDGKPGEKPLPARQRFVEQIWSALATGKIVFADGREVPIDGGDFISLARLVLAQIDGPPPASVDLTSDGQPLAFNVIEIQKQYREPSRDTSEE